MKSRGMRRTFASTDVTYCTNRDCSKKCWRHVDNYRFDLDQDYETGELWDDPRILRGWEITDKGRQTEMCKERSKNMSRIIKEVWGD